MNYRQRAVVTVAAGTFVATLGAADFGHLWVEGTAGGWWMALVGLVACGAGWWAFDSAAYLVALLERPWYQEPDDAIEERLHDLEGDMLDVQPGGAVAARLRP